MGDKQKTRNERRSKTPQLIDHMLAERNQLLALLLQVSGIKMDAPKKSDNDLLNEFCQVLVDYIAAGHFGLYERIIEKKERRKSVSDLAVKVYPFIDETTQLSLAFNERYDSSNHSTEFSKLPQDLSRLGEALTTRMELEDQLINQMLAPRGSIQA